MQRGIVADVEREGYSLVTFSDLFPDPERWAEIEAMRDGSSPRRRATSRREANTFACGGQGVRGAPPQLRRQLGLDDPWFAACASRRMLDVANAYLRMWSKLEYVDVWYSVPQPEDASRVSSQLWHRDYNDKHC